MNWFSGFKNPFANKSSADLEAEKTAEIAKLTQSYDEKIAAAQKAAAEAAPAATGTTGAVGGRKKTRKTRRRKSTRSRSGRKSSRL